MDSALHPFCSRKLSEIQGCLRFMTSIPGLQDSGENRNIQNHRLIINMPPEFLIGPFSCGSCKSRLVQVHLIVKGCSVVFWKSI